MLQGDLHLAFYIVIRSLKGRIPTTRRVIHVGFRIALKQAIYQQNSLCHIR